MQYMWFQNRKPTNTEKTAQVIKIFVIFFIIPLLFAYKTIQEETETGGPGVCSLGMLVLFLFSLLLSLGLLEQLRPLDKVAISHNDILFNFRDWPEAVIEWNRVYSIVPSYKSKNDDYQLFITQENSGILTNYLITAEIAQALKVQMIDRGYKFSSSGKVKNSVKQKKSPVSDDNRFCPECGKKNDGWAYCPECGNGWN